MINSIVGRRCKIGDNVRIENSYIWDDVVIEDGSSIARSILANSVFVGQGASIPEGSLLSSGVHVSSGIQLPANPPSILSLVSQNGKPLAPDDKLVGQGGKGARYNSFGDEVEDGEEEEDQFDERDLSILQGGLIYSLQGLNISTSSISTFASHSSDDSSDADSQAPSHQPGGSVTSRSRLSSFASDDSAAAAARSSGFHTDAVNGLVDALRADDTSDFDSAKLEFMGLRLANDASDQAMRRAVAVAFARRASEFLTPEHGALEPTRAAGLALTSKKGAVKFIKEVAAGGSEAEQLEFALALQKALVNTRNLEVGRAGTLLAALFQQLYSQEVLEEEAILGWWADKRASEGETMGTVRSKCRVLVEWLENADEEESEEESDDE